MTDKRSPRGRTRTMEVPRIPPKGAARVQVVGRSDLLGRTGARVELLTRMERAGLLRPIAVSPTEVYYAPDALAQVERVQTLVAAGYAERDVAHVAGRVAVSATTPVENVLELDKVPGAAGIADGLVPLWGQSEAGQRLIRHADEDLCYALVALPLMGLSDLSQALVAAMTGVSGDSSELRAKIEARLTELDHASTTLRATLAKLGRTRSRSLRTAALRRLLRRPATK